MSKAEKFAAMASELELYDSDDRYKTCIARISREGKLILLKDQLWENDALKLSDFIRRVFE